VSAQQQAAGFFAVGDLDSCAGWERKVGHGVSAEESAYDVSVFGGEPEGASVDLAPGGAAVVLEFVDRGDPMVERLLRNRREQSIDYSREALEAALANRFRVVARTALASGTRTVYHCRPTAHGER